MVAGKPVSVQSPASNEIAPAVCAPGRLRSCSGGCGKGGAALAHDLPWRQSVGGASRQRGRLPPPRAQIVCANCSRGVSSKRSPALIVTDSRPGKAKIHCVVPLTTPMIGGCPAGGSMRKCALTMARNSVGTREARHQRRRGIGRHREDHGIVVGRAQRLIAEIERRDALLAEAHGAQLMFEPHSAPRSRRYSSAGSISVGARPSRAISGRQARPPAASVSRITAAASFAEPSRRIDIERGEQERLDQPRVKRAVAGDHLADRLAGARPQQPRQRRDNRAARVPGTRRLESKIHNGSRPSLKRSVQRSPVVEIDKRKFGVLADRSGDAPTPILRRKASAA